MQPERPANETLGHYIIKFWRFEQQDYFPCRRLYSFQRILTISESRIPPKKAGAARSAKTIPESCVGTVCASLRTAAIALAWTVLKAKRED